MGSVDALVVRADAGAAILRFSRMGNSNFEEYAAPTACGSAQPAARNGIFAAAKRITWPLLAATYLAPLGEFVPITVTLHIRDYREVKPADDYFLAKQLLTLFALL